MVPVQEVLLSCVSARAAVKHLLPGEAAEPKTCSQLKGFKGAERVFGAGPCEHPFCCNHRSIKQRKRVAGRWGEPGGSDLNYKGT